MIYDKRHLIRATVPWYIRFLLEFRPVTYSHDGDLTLCIKQLFGKTYVLSEITADEDLA